MSGEAMSDYTNCPNCNERYCIYQLHSCQVDGLRDVQDELRAQLAAITAELASEREHLLITQRSRDELEDKLYSTLRGEAPPNPTVAALRSQLATVTRERDAARETIADLRTDVAKARAQLATVTGDLRIAIDKGWSNGGTLVAFCSYCEAEIISNECGHDADCLVEKYDLSRAGQTGEPK